MLTELEAYQKIVDSCQSVTLSLNDTFYYACSDSETIDSEDVKTLMPLIQEFGFDALVAFVAIQRGHDPQIPQHITPEYTQAKAKLEQLLVGGHITLYTDNS